jgi:hypothetical protein
LLLDLLAGATEGELDDVEPQHPPQHVTPNQLRFTVNCPVHRIPLRAARDPEYASVEYASVSRRV